MRTHARGRTSAAPEAQHAACGAHRCGGAAGMRLTIALATIGVALVIAASAAASSDQTVSPRDNCGGFNGHVVLSDGSTPNMQLYGEAWDNNCPGATSVWLAWQSPAYHNISVQTADEPATVGVNYTTAPLQVPADRDQGDGVQHVRRMALRDAGERAGYERRDRILRQRRCDRRVDRRLGGAQCRVLDAAAGDQRLRSGNDRGHQGQPRGRGLLGAEQRVRLARPIRPERWVWR